MPTSIRISVCMQGCRQTQNCLHNIQLTLEWHGFELHGSIYTWFLTVQCCKVFSPPYSFLHNIVFSLAGFIVIIQYMTQTICRICVNQLHVISRFLVNSRLLIVKFGGSQKLYPDFKRAGGSAPLTAALFKSQLYVFSPGSGVFISSSYIFCICWMFAVGVHCLSNYQNIIKQC